MTDPSFNEPIYQEEIYRIPAPVTIVLSCSWSEVGEQFRLPLAKILKALGHSLESARFIRQSPFDLSVFAEKPERMIVFVNPPKGLSLYEVHTTGNTSIVFAGGLEVLTEDEATKRKFWAALQALFPA